MSIQKVYVAGHSGMVGSALVRRLKKAGYDNILVRSHDELDLTDQDAVLTFLKKEKPDYIFLAAAKVGGIQANNTLRAEFIYQNLMIQANVIHSAWLAGIERLMFFGASCIYPRDCAQPIKEEYLLTGPLEPTHEPYAIAKIAGIKQCESYNNQYGTQYVCSMPASLYGPNDNYDPSNSHVLPALIRKCHEAKCRNDSQLVVWGTGKPRREFLFVDDLADACIFLMENKIANKLVNIGWGNDISIQSLIDQIMNVVGFRGDIIFDTTKPDGTYRKLLNVDQMNQLGWTASTDLSEGLQHTYQDFLAHENA